MRDDQATGLRRLFRPADAPVVAVGGTDAAAIAVHLARALAADGAQVLVVDRTVGEIATAAGIRTRYDLAHALDGDRAPADVLCDGPDGIVVLPAARAFGRFSHEHDWRAAIAASAACRGVFDAWIVHGTPPVGARGLVALAPTAEAITAAYAVLKDVARVARGTSIGAIVHKAATPAAAREVYASVSETARRFLGIDLTYASFLPEGPSAHPATLAWPRLRATSAGAAFIDLARRLIQGPARVAAHP